MPDSSIFHEYSGSRRPVGVIIAVTEESGIRSQFRSMATRCPGRKRDRMDRGCKMPDVAKGAGITGGSAARYF